MMFKNKKTVVILVAVLTVALVSLALVAAVSAQDGTTQPTACPLGNTPGTGMMHGGHPMGYMDDEDMGPGMMYGTQGYGYGWMMNGGRGMGMMGHGMMGYGMMGTTGCPYAQATPESTASPSN